MQLLPISGNMDSVYTIQAGLTRFKYRVYYNTKYRYWSLDLLTEQSEPIVRGIKIVLNTPLTLPYTDDRLPTGEIFCLSNETKPLATPNISSLGKYANLYIITEDDL